jgi:hypothetical protein
MAASAAPIVLDFENISLTYPSGFPFVQNYYNGGTSSVGSSGTDYGVSFSSNAQAICLNTIGVTCSNSSRGDLAPASAEGALFFLDGSGTFMNVAAGFGTGFSFVYSAPNSAGLVSVHDGLNGSGNVLAILALPTTLSGPCPGYNAGFCPFVQIGVAFEGIAKSVSFSGVANQIVLDDVTFGSAGTSVPEPATFALLGLGMIGAAFARRKRIG